MKGNVAGQGVVRGFPEEVTSEDEKVSRPCKDLGHTSQEEPAWAQAWYVPGRARRASVAAACQGEGEEMRSRRCTRPAHTGPCGLITNS